MSRVTLNKGVFFCTILTVLNMKQSLIKDYDVFIVYDLSFLLRLILDSV